MWYSLLLQYNHTTKLFDPTEVSIRKLFHSLDQKQIVFFIILVRDKIKINWPRSHNENSFQYRSPKLPCNYMCHLLHHELYQWHNGVIYTDSVCTPSHSRKKSVQEICQLKPLWNLFECINILVSQGWK